MAEMLASPAARGGRVAAGIDGIADRYRAAGYRAVTSRQAVFAALVATGFANGISDRVYRSIAERGVLDAAMATFDVSIILWGAGAVAIRLLLTSPGARDVDGRDLAVLLGAAICFLLPVPALGWVGICAIAAHLHIGAQDQRTKSAAALIFALTVPLLWARLLFAACTDVILRIDAQMVGWAIGTDASNNIVPYANGAGALFLAPGCSSVANLSLAVLSAAVFVHLRGARWTGAAIFWCAFSMAAVVAINVDRLALMALYPAYYDLIHGALGAAVAAWSTLAAILLVGYHRIGIDASSRA